MVITYSIIQIIYVYRLPLLIMTKRFIKNNLKVMFSHNIIQVATHPRIHTSWHKSLISIDKSFEIEIKTTKYNEFKDFLNLPEAKCSNSP